MAKSKYLQNGGRFSGVSPRSVGLANPANLSVEEKL
jgi:hypothetical protein